MKNPEVKNAPLWRKSMLSALNLDSILMLLEEIAGNGCIFGYEYGDESEYYLEYKELFDELALGAYELWEALQESELRENWDNMTVALLGHTHKVIGFDVVQEDYFAMLNNYAEEKACEVSEQRIEKLTKRELIRCFQKVLTLIVLFLDIKAAHDSLCAIVEELDSRGAMLKQKYNEVSKMVSQAQKGDVDIDDMAAVMPGRAWVE
jgi:hypothetical protein